ncbi:MAG: caspase family protein [Gallionellaceae bacterium]
MKKWQIVFVMLTLFVSGPARAEIHALIMTIGEYQGGIPKLKGVIRDVGSARSIAHLLGARDENILQFNNEQLNLAGMKHAFDELDRRVMPGDKVFIYYSGHGGRQRVVDPEPRCAESLVTVDGYGLIDAELEARLKKMSQRTQKTIAMFDACHSGGVATRAINNRKFAPKFWSKAGPNTCSKPVNVLTRGIKLATQSVGTGGNNYVYIAAARDNEVSLDQPGKGGMATTAWLECMSGSASDSDGSGGLTVEEIQVCAQKKINHTMEGAKGFSAQHINVTGNSKLVMTLTSIQAETPQTLVVQPGSIVKPEPVIQPVVASNASATLSDIYNGRDDKRTVKIITDSSKLRIGQDKFTFKLRSSHSGYLYLLMVGSDGKTFDLLFPNKLDGKNFVQAEQLQRFPRPNWEVTAQGPVGKDRILAIVADAPRDLSKLPLVNAGPFSVISVNQLGARGIQLVTSASTSALQKQCSHASTRNLALAKSCSDAYGAALVVMEEVAR